jgi:cell division protein ZapB
MGPFCQTGTNYPRSLSKHIQFGSLLLDLIGLFPETCFMSVSLDQLEHKVEQILAVCGSLRSENQVLRAHVAGLEAEKAALAKKIDITRERLEGLVARLPDE